MAGRARRDLPASLSLLGTGWRAQGAGRRAQGAGRCAEGAGRCAEGAEQCAEGRGLSRAPADQAGRRQGRGAAVQASDGDPGPRAAGVGSRRRAFTWPLFLIKITAVIADLLKILHLKAVFSIIFP